MVKHIIYNSAHHRIEDILKEQEQAKPPLALERAVLIPYGNIVLVFSDRRPALFDLDGEAIVLSGGSLNLGVGFPHPAHARQLAMGPNLRTGAN